MARFEIETPQGRFEVEAPDIETALQALSGQSGNAFAGTQAEGSVQPKAAEEQRGFFRRVDDAVRGAADMMTFGFADEIAAGANAALGSGDYASNVAKERARDAGGGMERFGGQVAGALALPGKLAASVGGAALKGAMGGAAYGLGSGEGTIPERLPSAGIGAAFGGAAGGALRGVANRLQTRAAAKSIASNEGLRSTAEAGYKAADDAGVIVKPDGIRSIGQGVVDDLADMGYHPVNQPKIGALLSEIERLGNTNSTYKGLQTFKKMIANVAASNDPTERAMAMRIMNRLDAYMRKIPEEDLIAGNAQAASRGFQQGQDNWAKMRRSEMVDTARIKAERRAASTGSGGNLENAIRQNVRGILDNPRRSRGMTKAELDLADKVVMGTPTQNILRGIGKLSPTTGGLSALANVGGAMLNPMLAVPGAIGFAAKTVADRMTIKNASRLSQIIRSGGKTATELAALARNDKLNGGQVYRIEKLARSLGLTVPQLSAAVGSLLEKHAVQN